MIQPYSPINLSHIQDVDIFSYFMMSIENDEEQFASQSEESLNHLIGFVNKVDDLFLKKIVEMSTTEQMKNWQDCCLKMIHQRENGIMTNLSETAQQMKQVRKEMENQMIDLFNRAVAVRLELQSAQLAEDQLQAIQLADELQLETDELHVIQQWLVDEWEAEEWQIAQLAADE